MCVFGGYIPDSKRGCMYNAWNIYVNGRFLEVITYFNIYYNPSGHSGAASVTYYWNYLLIIKFKLYPHYLLRTELSKWLGPSYLQVDHLLFLCIMNGLSRRTTCSGIHCGVKCNWLWNVMLLHIQIKLGYNHFAQKMSWNHQHGLISVHWFRFTSIKNDSHYF